MITDVATRKARLETLLQRVQTNRARLGGSAAVAPRAEPVEDEEPLTNELASKAPRAARQAPVEAPPTPMVWEADDDDIEMEIIGEASSEEALLGTMASGAAQPQPPPPPPLPSTTVSPTAAAPPVEAAPVEEALPASIRIESPAPVDVSPIAFVGDLTAASPPTIGALLRASILPLGTS
jgi:hypothetical protein